jgi:hypothetical protein
MSELPLHEWVLDQYQTAVRRRFPAQADAWPLLMGCNFRVAGLPGGAAVIVDDTRNPNMTSNSGLGELNAQAIGVSRVTADNAEQVRSKIRQRYGLRPQDGVFILISGPEGLQLHPQQVENQIHQHAQTLGLVPMRIFLSHKGVDKEMVRRFQRLLKELGFDPWLDDDAMPAGVQPDRAILQGFKDSCAAVFFVTPDFKDEKWLATEIEYARTQKREKGDEFAINTLCLTKGSDEGAVPELLKSYIYKKPLHELDAMFEIVRALPIVLGEPRYR